MILYFNRLLLKYEGSYFTSLSVKTDWKEMAGKPKKTWDTRLTPPCWVFAWISTLLEIDSNTIVATFEVQKGETLLMLAIQRYRKTAVNTVYLI